MKNKILIILLTVALVASGFLMADPTSSFDITTTVAGINQMKLTKAAFSGTNLSSAAAFEGNLSEGPAGWSVTAGGPQSGLAAHISTLSNNRAGYTVTMSATPMKSTINSVDAYINYIVSTVSTDGTEASSYNTKTDSTAVDVITVSSLDGLTGTSREISITVNADEFAAAVKGSYTGKITFTYTAN